MGEGECCSGFDERGVCQFITGKSSVTEEDPLKLKATREERESEGPKYPRRTLVGYTPKPWIVVQGPTGSQLGKGPIESGNKWPIFKIK